MTRAAARGLGRLMAALAGALAAATLAAGLARAGRLHTPAPALPRCYWLVPPLTHLQPVLLKRGVLDCRLSQCQLTLRQTNDAGWVCFFHRPWGANE